MISPPIKINFRFTFMRTESWITVISKFLIEKYKQCSILVCQITSRVGLLKLQDIYKFPYLAKVLLLFTVQCKPKVKKRRDGVDCFFLSDKFKAPLLSFSHSLIVIHKSTHSFHIEAPCFYMAVDFRPYRECKRSRQVLCQY